MTRLCRDCRWIEWPPPPSWQGVQRAYEAMCRHAASVRPRPADLVLGKPQEPRQMHCDEARAWIDGCGPEGRHWEAA